MDALFLYILLLELVLQVIELLKNDFTFKNRPIIFVNLVVSASEMSLK